VKAVSRCLLRTRTGESLPACNQIPSRMTDGMSPKSGLRPPRTWPNQCSPRRTLPKDTRLNTAHRPTNTSPATPRAKPVNKTYEIRTPFFLPQGMQWVTYFHLSEGSPKGTC